MSWRPAVMPAAFLSVADSIDHLFASIYLRWRSIHELGLSELVAYAVRSEPASTDMSSRRRGSVCSHGSQ
jgi:hypothetical protein